VRCPEHHALGYVSVMESTHADVAAATRDKEHALMEWIRRAAPIAIGFSGGVDSAYLAALAVEAAGAAKVIGFIGRSASYPESQWVVARTVAERVGLTVVELDTDEMNDPRYAANPTNRCYFCKTELWSRIVPAAQARGVATVVDGTNADDLSDHRPGAAAAREMGVQSPLADAGLTKAEIRSLSHMRGLPTWSQPSAPCLSSRIPYGTAVTADRLRAVERAEEALRAFGIHGDLRVRHHGDLARIEVGVEELATLLNPNVGNQLRAAVIAAGFVRVAIDLRGFRSGSLNVLGGVTTA
jgi:uncharacterized protein